MTKPLESHQPIAMWFRCCLLMTAIFNLFGAISFAPPVYYLFGSALGSPEGISPFVLWVISSWILIFGVSYIWLAIKAQPEKLFVAVAAACKLAIAILFFIFWLIGTLPLISLFAGCGDFLFALTFIFWLLSARSTGEALQPEESRK